MRGPRGIGGPRLVWARFGARLAGAPRQRRDFSPPWVEIPLWGRRHRATAMPARLPFCGCGGIRFRLEGCGARTAGRLFRTASRPPGVDSSPDFFLSVCLVWAAHVWFGLHRHGEGASCELRFSCVCLSPFPFYRYSLFVFCFFKPTDLFTTSKLEMKRMK